MKPRLIFSHWIFRLPLAKKYSGMVVGRFILFKRAQEQVSARLIRHEMIHQEQMDRLGVVGFYIKYLAHYLRGLIRFRNHDKAYRESPLEVEAYARQHEVSNGN